MPGAGYGGGRRSRAVVRLTRESVTRYADVGQAERTSITTSGATTSLLNGLNLGVTAQKVGSAPVRFVRDPYGNLVAMVTGTTTLTHSYYITDRLGSVLALSNAAGTAEVATYTYDPYGKTTQTGTLAATNPLQVGRRLPRRLTEPSRDCWRR